MTVSNAEDGVDDDATVGTRMPVVGAKEAITVGVLDLVTGGDTVAALVGPRLTSGLGGDDATSVGVTDPNAEDGVDDFGVAGRRVPITLVLLLVGAEEAVFACLFPMCFEGELVVVLSGGRVNSKLAACEGVADGANVGPLVGLKIFENFGALLGGSVGLNVGPTVIGAKD